MMARFVARSSGAAIVVALAVVVSGGSCKPRPAPGGKCAQHGKVTCEDPWGALYCFDGVLERVTCRGPGGCVPDGDGVACDDAIAAEGDLCMMASIGNHACTPDGHEAVVCEAKGYVGWRTCRGPKGCAVASGRVECDQTRADDGDACGSDGAFACSAAGPGMVRCDGERFRRVSGCRGPKGCSRDLATNKTVCDDTVAAEGDPCATSTNACSQDLHHELECHGGAWRVERECASGCVPQVNADPRCSP
jgi:hypothetical protein